MNHDSPPTPPPPSSSPPPDAELEARIVAWVAGELSASEVAELEKLVAAQPALADFKRHIEAVESLVIEAERTETEPLHLSAERREKLLLTLGRLEASTSPAPAEILATPAPVPFRRTHWKKQWWIFSAAACATLGFFLFTKIESTFGSSSQQLAKYKAAELDNAKRVAAMDKEKALKSDVTVSELKESLPIPTDLISGAEAPAGNTKFGLFLEEITKRPISEITAGKPQGLDVSPPDKSILARQQFGDVGGSAIGKSASGGKLSVQNANGIVLGQETPINTGGFYSSAITPPSAFIGAAGTVALSNSAKDQRLTANSPSVHFGAPALGSITLGADASPPSKQRNERALGAVTVVESAAANLSGLALTSADGRGALSLTSTGGSIAPATDVSFFDKEKTSGAGVLTFRSIAPADPAQDYSRVTGGISPVAVAGAGGAAVASATTARSDDVIKLDAFMVAAPTRSEPSARPTAPTATPAPSIAFNLPSAPAEEQKQQVGSLAAVALASNEKSNFVSLDSRKDIVNDALKAANLEATRAALQLKGAEIRLDQVKEQRARGSVVTDLPFVANQPNIAALAQQRAAQQTAVAQLRDRYEPNHPKAIEEARALTQTERELNQAVENASAQIVSDYQSALRANEEQQKKLDQQKSIAPALAAPTPAPSLAAPTPTSPPPDRDEPRPAVRAKNTPPPAPPAPTETTTAQDPVSTFSLHVSDVSFRLAQAALARGEAPDPARIRPEEFYNAFDYGDPAPSPAEKISSRIEQSAHPFAQQRNLVRIAMKVGATGRGAGTPLRLTVLLDTSGSMEREDRAATVKRALAVLVSLLGANDRITLIGFARTPRLLAENLPGDRAGSLVDLLARTPADGGTNLEEALKLAGELARRHRDPAAQNRIVLLTDGAANLGDADPAHLALAITALRQQGIAFDACGVGLDGLDDEILESLTRSGDGRYYALNSPADADTGFAQKLAGAFRPAAENVKIQVRFNPARVGAYRLIGFEQHRLREEDFRNDRVDAAELAAEEAAVALYQVEVLPQGEGELGEVFVRFRDPATGNMVERSWPMNYDARAAAFDRATPSMQLAGTAALLAEKLRGGAPASAVRLAELAPIVNSLRARSGPDSRVQELATLYAQMRRVLRE